MTKISDSTYETILTNAYDAAAQAQSGMVENPHAPDCGFAWVIVHDRAFSAWCSKMRKAPATFESRRYGAKNWSIGWCFWKPGSFNGQSIGIHEAGARAFRDSLAHALQCRVEMGSRLD